MHLNMYLNLSNNMCILICHPALGIQSTNNIYVLSCLFWRLKKETSSESNLFEVEKQIKWWNMGKYLLFNVNGCSKFFFK